MFPLHKFYHSPFNLLNEAENSKIDELVENCKIDASAENCTSMKKKKKKKKKKKTNSQSSQGNPDQFSELVLQMNAMKIMFKEHEDQINFLLLENNRKSEVIAELKKSHHPLMDVMHRKLMFLQRKHIQDLCDPFRTSHLNPIEFINDRLEKGGLVTLLNLAAAAASPPVSQFTREFVVFVRNGHDAANAICHDLEQERVDQKMQVSTLEKFRLAECAASCEDATERNYYCMMYKNIFSGLDPTDFVSAHTN
jgi:hypothetical protein